MKNEKGYIVLTTIVMTIFTLFIVGYLATILVSERAFLENTKQLYIIENLRMLAVDSAIKKIKEGGIDKADTFYTTDGKFEYTVESLMDDHGKPTISMVQISCETNKNIKKVTSFHYDHFENKIVSWSEY